MLELMAGVLGAVKGWAAACVRDTGAAGGACPRLSPWRAQPEADCSGLSCPVSAGWKAPGLAAQLWGPALGACAVPVVARQVLRKCKLDCGRAGEG